MNNKYNYFYKIENLINGKFYYGIHRTKNLEDGYMGSGTRIKRSILKYGIENFKKEILKFFETYDEALEYEMTIVNETLLIDPSCYNLTLGGNSNCYNYNKSGKNKSTLRQGPALKHKITHELIKPKDIEEYKKLWSTGNYEGLNKGKSTYIDNNGNKLLLDTTDEKIISQNLKHNSYNRKCYIDSSGRIFYLYEDDEKIILKKLKKWSVTLGKKHTEETKQKIKNTHKLNGLQKGEKNSQYGTCFINLNGVNKRIKKEELKKWIDDGWNIGAKFKKS